MSKVNLNAIFYSKGNVTLAYNIKKALWDFDTNVINVSEFTELVYTIHSESINMLFIDCSTIKLTEELMQFSLGSKIGAPDNIIFIGTESVSELLINNQNRFLFSTENIEAQLKDVEGKIKFNIERCRGNKYNLQFVNTYLTQYLIQLGFYPKYAGFLFIKQCIEESLNNGGVLGSLSSQIYPVIARKNKTTPASVERNIRNSIECAHRFSEFKDKTLCDMAKQHRISNRAFLSYLLDQVLISHEELEKNKAAF